MNQIIKLRKHEDQKYTNSFLDKNHYMVYSLVEDFFSCYILAIKRSYNLVV